MINRIVDKVSAGFALSAVFTTATGNALASVADALDRWKGRPDKVKDLEERLTEARDDTMSYRLAWMAALEEAGQTELMRRQEVQALKVQMREQHANRQRDMEEIFDLNKKIHELKGELAKAKRRLSELGVED